ncbi:MAG: anhydro-N-acetylmuramic acid kinase [Limisphaerales bacterium]
MKPLRVLGIMSGTSLDGVDHALCDVSTDGVKLLELWSAGFPKALQRRLQLAARGEATSWELAQLHHDLGRFYAAAAQRNLAVRRAQLVGVHGQTVFHHPHRTRPATLQLGEPAYLAEALRVPVVSNFRVADLAAGGQGAPLATLFHEVVFARRGEHVCINNLGGISNVTSLDWRRGAQPRVLAFDTGPANVLLDLASRHLTLDRSVSDRDGRLAALGLVHHDLLERWLKHPYFRKPPPKSTGRELFGEQFLRPALVEMESLGLDPADFFATLTMLTARSLALNYRLHLPAPPDRMVLCGGGTFNPTLVAAIRRELISLNPNVDVSRSDDVGWPAQSIEAAAFALLTWRRWHGLPGNLPATTGARRPVLCGQITAVQ